MKNKFGLLSSILIVLSLLLVAPHLTVSAVSGPNLQIINLSGATFNFTYDQLLAMPKTTVTSDLFCVGSLVTTGDWDGISLSYLLTQAQISPNVMSIDFVATDNYQVSIPISLAMQPEIIIAYSKNNQTLNEGLRLVLPGINGPTWIASISSIGMSTVQVADPSSAGTTSGGIPVIPYPSDEVNGSTSQQEAGQPTPTILQSQPSPTATTSPADTIDPYQAKSVVQPLSPQNRVLSIVLLTAIVLLVVSFAAVYITVRRGKSTSIVDSDLGS